MQTIKYRVTISDISAHLIDIELRFVPQQDNHILSLPAWIPGSYMIRDFARNLISITATNHGGELTLQQLDKQCWQLTTNNNQEVTVRYQMYANDLSVRAAYIDDELAVLNPAALCLSVSGLELLQHELMLPPPEARVTGSWQVATGLTPASGTEFMQFGNYLADNYQQLIDSPVLLGALHLQQFDIDGVPHYLVFTGQNLTDYPRICRDVEIICRQQASVFGGLPQDLTAYWFLVWVTENGYGGLEHHNSTLLLCNRFDLPVPGALSIDDNYQNFLALCSHEYFHTWWVKRLKPATFRQYQLQHEQYTRQLWIYEGFTSYFDDLALVKCGLISPQQYLTTLEKTITRVTRNRSDTIQSLQDSSFTAWTKFYKQDENAVNAVVSYYSKGALLALCLDAALRQQHSNLNQLVVYLWQHYLQDGTDDNSLFEALKRQGFGDTALLVDRWVNQPVSLPLEHLLPELGVALTFRYAEHADDLGGQAKSVRPLPYLGAQYKSSNTGIQLTHVHNGSAAHQAGLMTGDQLIAIAGRRLTESSFTQLLQRLPEGSSQQLHFFRKDRLLTTELKLQPSALQVAQLSIIDPQKLQLWLQGGSQSAGNNNAGSNLS